LRDCLVAEGRAGHELGLRQRIATLARAMTSGWLEDRPVGRYDIAAVPDTPGRFTGNSRHRAHNRMDRPISVVQRQSGESS
jgi:hypothetical protein